MRPRLPACQLPLAADERPHRRVRRFARESPALSASPVRRGAKGLARGQADVGSHFRDRLGGWRHQRRGIRCDRPRLRRARRRSGGRLDGADRQPWRADVRTHVPDAVLGPHSQRGACRHHVRRRDHHRGPGEHHPRRRTRRPGRACQAASGRPVLHAARGRLVWRDERRLPAAVSARPRSGLPQQRA